MENFDIVVNRKNTLSRKWDGRKEVFGTDDLLPMWVADMDFLAPRAVIEGVTAAAQQGVYGYPLRRPTYFQAIIDWQQRRHDYALTKECLVCTPAVVTAISVAIQTFTEPGDEILVQSPVYPAFFSCITKNKRQIVENPLQYKEGRYVMDFADLEKKLTSRVKMLILCSPHNPVGRVWEQAELARLAELCVAHNVIVLADEMHGDLVFAGQRHTSFATISKKIAQQTITFISPCKTFNLAAFYNSITIIENASLRKQFIEALEALELLSGNIFGIISLELAYQYGEQWLNELLIYLADNAQYLTTFIEEQIPRLKVVKPEGTYLAWVDCRGLNLTLPELQELFLYKAKVGVNDGTAFGQNGVGFMRLNFGCPRSTLEEGLLKIKNAIDQLP